MFNFKPVLAATVIALAVPLATTSPSFAQTKGQYSGGAGGGHGGGGGHMSHGGGGGGRHMAGGGWHGGHHHRHHRHFGGFYPGFGFGIGSAWGWGSPYYSYSSPYYYDNYGYYDDGPTVVAGSSSRDIEYCQQRFKSYDVRSGTYLGYDGKRHPCP